MFSRGRVGLSVVALLAAALGLSACVAGPPAPPPPPPPPPSGPCQSALSADGNPAPPPVPSPVPVSPSEAEALAVSAVAASTTRNVEGEIPLVTVEQTPNGPEITSTPVASAEEAADVAAARAADGALVAVDVDSPVSVASHASNDTYRDQQWALDQVAFEQAWVDDGVNGAGVTVAIVDTGVLQSHADLSGQVLTGREFLGSNHQNVIGGTTDSNGHGTHVAGIIAAVSNNAAGITGAAPGVDILPVKVLCPNGEGSNSDVAAGVIWAVNNEAKVVNLSLGGSSSTAVKNALVHAQTQGVTVVAAAGNCGQGGSGCSIVNQQSFPAAYSQSGDGVEAIAVAATTNAAPPGHACYSNSNTYVDIAAPGGAGSCNPSGNVLSTYGDGTYKSIAGTSMATPHVAAAAALLVQKGCTVSQVRARLTTTANDLGMSGWDPQFGTGLVDPLEAAATCV